MDTKLTLNMKKKSTLAKNKKIKQNNHCPCISFLLALLKINNKAQRTRNSAKGTRKSEIVKKFDDKTSVVKSNRKPHIIRIPKIGCEVPFLVTLFTNLSNTGVVHMDEREIMKAVNITAKAKKDLDEGKKWNGNIEIAENLKLKLYKTGLVLYHKK